MTATTSKNRIGGPGGKEKQEKPSVQSTEEERQLKKVEERAHHGGRGEWPDEDVNPAPEMHVEEGEKGEPARSDTHDAQKRKDKKRPRDR
ncbi:MAG: hypothetical protein CMI63_01530 [Parvularcula sp.]|nr:hypothetical protein [Parvularcula sp.]